MLEEYKTEQPIIYQILINTIKKNKYSHAYLFESNGYYKVEDLVKSFAKLILCDKTNIDQKFCKNCNQCNLIDKNEFLELKIIKTEGQWIKKNQLEELQIEFNKKPIIGTRKVYIILEAEKLNESASNSLLKFLEEPQEGVIAILIVNNSTKLLDTIVSRCQILSCKKNNTNENQNDIYFLAKYLFNNEEEIIRFVNDEESTEKINKTISFIEYYEKNKEKAIIYIKSLWHDNFINRNDFIFAFNLILLYYKDVLNYCLKRKIEYFSNYLETIKTISNNNSIEIISSKINVVLNLKDLIKYNVNTNLLMDKLIIDLKGCEQND